MQDLSDRIFELRTDFGEDNAENDAIRIPAHEISLAGGFQKNRRHLRHEAVGCFAFTKFTCVQQHQNKWLSRALRPPALKRQHGVERVFWQDLRSPGNEGFESRHNLLTWGTTLTLFPDGRNSQVAVSHLRSILLQTLHLAWLRGQRPINYANAGSSKGKIGSGRTAAVRTGCIAETRDLSISSAT